MLQAEAQRLADLPGARACLVFDHRGALQLSGIIGSIVGSVIALLVSRAIQSRSGDRHSVSR